MYHEQFVFVSSACIRALSLYNGAIEQERRKGRWNEDREQDWVSSGRIKPSSPVPLFPVLSIPQGWPQGYM